ncbi:MAG: lipid-A-disaccharide synthase [Porticoccaceae bacterium]|nr:lipid-A-disaccharide synthase [Porticoccaceae bacterium]MDG1474049.1 lipid-A-disaccharide synthase [Porticoccaceae bacterium]
MTVKAPVFAIVAGEASGDVLGADLIRGLKRIFPNASFEGIGGDKMKAEGFNSLHDMERLSVMGFIEPLKRISELLNIRRSIIKRYKTSPPLVFIGIDSPDFTTHIELKLKQIGIKTAHYVSPSVWAWRQGRIKKIKRAVDLMLTLLPFEAAFYRQHKVPVRFVGHPLATELNSQPEVSDARKRLGLDLNQPLLCVMPGSRSGEVALLAKLFIAVARDVTNKIKNLHVVVPAANEARHRQLQEILSAQKSVNITLILRNSHLAMAASDAVLLASGTTALEAMLLKKPMVVSYKLGKITHALVSPFIKTPYVSIPNLLANEMLVPELIQENATLEKLSFAVHEALSENNKRHLLERFEGIQSSLTLKSGDLAAQAILELLE